MKVASREELGDFRGDRRADPRYALELAMLVDVVDALREAGDPARCLPVGANAKGVVTLEGEQVGNLGEEVGDDFIAARHPTPPLGLARRIQMAKWVAKSSGDQLSRGV